MQFTFSLELILDKMSLACNLYHARKFADDFRIHPKIFRKIYEIVKVP